MIEVSQMKLAIAILVSVIGMLSVLHGAIVIHDKRISNLISSGCMNVFVGSIMGLIAIYLIAIS